MTESEERFAKTFFPYASQRMAEVKAKKTRFVHYTSANSAMGILKNREIWMRNSTCMNDYREIMHGLESLRAAYDASDSGKRFRSSLNGIFDGIASEIEGHYNHWVPRFESETYLTCISEHNDDEDALGRLSMWRSYGEPSGVALVLNHQAFFSDSNVLGVYSSPVGYLDKESFGEMLDEVAQNVEANASEIKKMGREKTVEIVSRMFMFAALSAKHPGFKEEREWRVIYSPYLIRSTDDKKPVVTKTIQSVHGVPQIIYKIPLKNVPEQGLKGLDPAELINRMIIGPSQYPKAMYQAFVELLAEAGISDPESKVSVSETPLRAAA
ncbi:MAG: DUF2971 domain-containing protein [Bdellovibrionia bacterium]